MSAKPTLLIVDDDRGIADIVTEVAEAMGFSVSVARNGTAFHDAYAVSDPDVIFLDLKLPGFDGIELLKFLGEQHCRSTVYIVSGADRRTLQAALSVGKQLDLTMGGTLAKPLMIEDIETALTQSHQPGQRIRFDELRRALDNDEFQAHFQPKIDLLSNDGPNMAGVEALARWSLPDGGWRYPDQFIPALREAGLMREFTDQIAEKSFAAIRSWRDKGLSLNLSFNLDGSTLDDETLPDFLAQLADKYEVDPSQVTVELTESAAMSAPAATMDILTRLRLKDFTVSIDDFGTGYSSLVQLYRLPFNELKIDKSFVMDIGGNGEAEIIVEILVLLGKKLGLKVCAEGIENGAMLKHVQASGCDLGQGYLFSKPVDATMIEVLAERWGNPDAAAGKKSA